MQVDKNEFFREVTLRITSSLDIDESLERLYRYLKDFIPMDGIMLHYVEQDGLMYNVSLAGNPLEEEERIFGKKDMPILQIPPKFIQEFRELAMERGMMIEDVILHNQPGPKYFNDFIRMNVPIIKEMPSTMNLELVIQGEEVGRLSVSKYGKNVYTREHARLLQIAKEPVAIALSNARRYRELLRIRDILADDNRAMQRELERISGNQVVGADFGLRQVMEMVRQVAPLNNPVLLLGETGTGKEVIANAIHTASSAREKRIVRVQCGAIPDTLLDSELFGHEKGAFTGALATKRGRFERADGGTIFLDEIGELTLDAQVKLLRVLQEHEIERLGGQEVIKVDVRVIAATNRDLEERVRAGAFREDLYYRLNVFPIHLPPLRERKEDIPALTLHFMERKSREMGLMKTPFLGESALARLKEYDWPGNVRELQNVVERAIITNRDGTLTFDNLVVAPRRTVVDRNLSDTLMFPTLDEAMAEYIRQAMKISEGKVEGPGGAAERLGLNPSTLRARMRKLKIPFGRLRPE